MASSKVLGSEFLEGAWTIEIYGPTFCSRKGPWCKNGPGGALGSVGIFCFTHSRLADRPTTTRTALPLPGQTPSSHHLPTPNSRPQHRRQTPDPGPAPPTLPIPPLSSPPSGLGTASPPPSPPAPPSLSWR
jgi:hypothetical protein